MVINASGRIKFAQYLDIAVGYNTFKYIKNELSCIFLILKQCYKDKPARALQIWPNDVYCLELTFENMSSTG